MYLKNQLMEYMKHIKFKKHMKKENLLWTLLAN